MISNQSQSMGLILIVDDIPSNLNVLSETLSSAGYNVSIAKSGERALKQIGRKLPDLILLDIAMPHMDGFEVCQQLKSCSDTCDIPVIFMTASTDLESKVKSFDIGGVDYITKPFQEQEVLARIKTHLQLRRLTQSLEQEVARQVVSLQEAKTIAEEASLAKSQFLAGVSHELRTPLNSILGISEGLQEEVFGSLNYDQLQALQTIQRNGSQLLKLINDILDVSKIESGQIELEYKAATVPLLCQESLSSIKPLALKKQIQIVVKLPDYLPNLMIDERRIRQVLINLLDNAVKFTPEGGQVTLEASLQHFSTGQPDQAPQNSLKIAVSDTGIGIAPEHHHKLFRPFIQIDSTLNRQYKGTGLGLALVKRIIELHGGQVGLTSELGIGSCFTITLPYTTSILSACDLETHAELNLSQVENNQKLAPLVLLAEDNEANILSISSYLKAKNYRILLARTEKESLNLSQSNPPNLILMDIQSPRIQGVETLKQIRLCPALAQIPIIALITMPGDHETCLTAGANNCLIKPVKLKQLVDMIQQLLNP